MLVPLVLGTFLLCLSYSYASRHSDGDQLHYLLFWAGIAVYVVPAAVRLANRSTPAVDRVMLVTILGVYLFVPKFLRDPSDVLYHDELAHSRQIDLISQTHSLFSQNPIIRVLGDFPGLHTMIALPQSITGLEVFPQAVVILVICHVLAAVGVYVLASTVLKSSRAGGVAAAIYVLNPSYMLFDAQLSYESVSMPLFIWTLACVAVALSKPRRGADAGAWFLFAAITGAACVVTHHLTTYILVSILLATCVVTAVRGRSDPERPGLAGLLAVTGFIGVLAGLWMAFVAPSIGSYLGPRISDGLVELADLITNRGNTPSKGQRQLFSQSVLPVYERYAAFLIQPLAAGAALWGLLLLRRRRPLASLHLVLAVVGLLYFPSLPLLLSTAGSEGARRSWGFSYLGLAILLAPLVVMGLDRAASWSPRRRRSLHGGLLASLLVLMVANQAMGLNPTYRFPGPYVYGSDTRSLTPELLAMSSYVGKTFGPGQKVVGDRYTTLPLAAFDREETSRASRGFPVWEMYFTVQPPSTKLLGQLAGSDWRYLVVDRQMARFRPLIGVYFEPDEPEAQVRTNPPPEAALTKYNRLPWAIKVFSSDNYDVYRFNFRALQTVARTS